MDRVNPRRIGFFFSIFVPSTQWQKQASKQQNKFSGLNQKRGGRISWEEVLTKERGGRMMPISPCC